MFQSMRKVLTLILTAAGLVAGLSFTTFAREPFRVTGVFLEAMPARYQGQCPMTIRFVGRIRANGPGRVIYAFLRSDGARGPEFTLDFDAAGERMITTTWTLGGPDFPVHWRWEAIRILAPNVMFSNQAGFQLICRERPVSGREIPPPPAYQGGYERRAIPERESGLENDVPPPPARGIGRIPPPPVVNGSRARDEEVSALPDLVVANLSLNPATPTEGQRVFVRIAVFNHSAAASWPFIVQWWPGENYRGPACTWRVEGLPVHRGQILTGVYEGYPSWYGRLTTKAVVDATNAVEESHEENNAERVTIRVLRPESN